MKSSSKPLFLFALVFSLGLGIYFSSQANTLKLTTRSSASGGNCSGDGETDFQGCVNGGNITNGCNWVCNTAPAGITLVIPSCCEELARTGDPTVCCFDARRRCTPQQCSSIPEGVPKERCAQLWELGYCTPQTQPTATPRPTSPVVPSNTPKPTKKPKATNIPTQPPPSQSPQATQPPQNTGSPTQNPNPTSFLQPTDELQPTTTTIYNDDAFFQSNGFNNTPSNQLYPEQLFPALSLPHVELPHIDIVGPTARTVTTIDAQLPRTLDFAEYVFNVVQIADRKLELFINSRFSRLLGQ